MDLFRSEPVAQPLAARLRPANLDEYVGQEHLLARGKPLREALEQGALHSMIFWGPPGVGKTTLARLLAQVSDAHFETISAVLSGVKEIRQAVEVAKQHAAQYGRRTILFVDEVHRFNKSQQDAFLPYVEDGTLIFIGATTENPSFELNNALLSRARVYVLKSLDEAALRKLVGRALNEDKGLGKRKLRLPEESFQVLLAAADGDGRRLLNLLENAADLAEDGSEISPELLQNLLGDTRRRFDKGGERSTTRSARCTSRCAAPIPTRHFIGSRVCSTAAAIPCTSPGGWCAWPARRLATPILAPRPMPVGLGRAGAPGQPRRRAGGGPGHRLPGCAPKSNAVYSAFNAAMRDVAESGSREVPLHLRNAPTKLMKSLGYGEEYRYAHDEPDAYAAGEDYFPEDLEPRRYYQPVPRGLELKIRDKLEHLAELDRTSPRQRRKS